MKKIKKIAKKRNKRIIKKAKKNVSKFPKAKVILRFAALPQATDKFIKVGNRLISHDQPVFITAEIGINHNGDLALAKQLINAAVTAGCDAVKFQKRTVPVIYSPEELAKPREVNKEILRNAVARGVLSPEATARLKTSNFENSVNGDLKWALEFTKDEYDEIARYARDKNIIWFGSLPVGTKRRWILCGSLTFPSTKLLPLRLPTIIFCGTLEQLANPLFFPPA